MYKVDLYAKLRRAVMVENQAERATAKRFGISRKTVSKMLRHTVPPGSTEAFLDGHVRAFAWLGGVPQSVLYDAPKEIPLGDNTKIAVAKILRDGRRTRTKAFAELQSHYLF